MTQKHRYIILLVAAIFSSLILLKTVYAQDNQTAPSENIENQTAAEMPVHTIESDKPVRTYKAVLKADQIPSLFFTYWQHQAILDSKNSKGLVNPPSDYELNGIGNSDEQLIDPGPRDIVVGGIVYNGKSNWTVWLNGQRVTPNALPKEILDLKVYENYLEIKWLDAFTGQIFPVRIRAHERFNLDTRMFLPG